MKTRNDVLAGCVLAERFPSVAFGTSSVRALVTDLSVEIIYAFMPEDEGRSLGS